MKRLLMAGCLLSTPAWALDHCAPSTYDAAVRICPYSPYQRYVVNAPVGGLVNLTFGEHERLKRYDFAYTGLDDKNKPATTWVGPNKGQSGDKAQEKDRYITNFPMWPLTVGKSALVVITDSNGQEKTYQFDLTATAAGTETADTTASLRFTYAEEEAEAAKKAAAEKKEAAAAAWREQQAKRSEAVALARLKTEVAYGKRNWAYRAHGKEKYKFLAPSEVSDNGAETVFRWPGNIQPPMIGIVDPATGDERSVIPDTESGLVVVHTTAAKFRLRLGHDAVMDILNLHWSAERPDPGTGTTSPDVIRTVTYGK